MTAQTFDSLAAPPSTLPVVDGARLRVGGAADEPPSDRGGDEPEESFGAPRWFERPFVTPALCLSMAVIFSLESQLVFDLGGKLALGRQALVPLGAASRDLVVDGGEWWRIFVAPFLHDGTFQLCGVILALASVGWRLERSIGSAWFGALFAITALASVAGSVVGHPHDFPTIGAVGAVWGLLFARLVPELASGRTDALHQIDLDAGMSSLSLTFLAEAVGGGTDGPALAAGAVTGALAGLVLDALRRSDVAHSAARRTAGTFALLCLALALGSMLWGSIEYHRHAPRFGDRIPSDRLTGDIGPDMLYRAEDLVARWPKDPRGRLMLGVAHIARSEPVAAEAELRTAIDMVSDPDHSPLGPVAAAARIHLAVAVAMQRRYAEASAIAAPFCAAAWEAGGWNVDAGLDRALSRTGVSCPPRKEKPAPTQPRSPAAP